MWLIVPASSHYSPEGEVSTSLSESQSQRLEQSVMWRSKHRQPRLWRLAWRKDHSIRRLSGATLEPLTADLGVSVWMESSAGSRVKTSRRPGGVRESTNTHARDCSSNTSASFAKFGRGGSLLKMSLQFSIFDQVEPYSENLPGSGSMRNGSLYERPMLGHRTNGNARSSWPTARGSDGEKGGPNQRGSKGSLMLSSAAAQWPTPNTPSGGPNTKSTATHTGGMDLDGAALMWMTPNCPNGGRAVSAEVVANKGKTEDAKRQVGLESQTAHWRTPNTRDHHAGGPREHHEQRQVCLVDQTRSWPTPKSQDSKHGAPTDYEMNEAQGGFANNLHIIAEKALQHSGCSLPDHLTQAHGNESSPNVPTSRRRLNPAFVSWLMGWPIHWTIREPIPSGCSETESYLYRQRMHLRYLLEGLESNCEVA